MMNTFLCVANEKIYNAETQIHTKWSIVHFLSRGLYSILNHNIKSNT